MKFIIPATTLLYATVQAEDTTEAPEEIGGRKFNSIVGMAHSQITTSFSKTEFGDKINKYGCHCFPGGTKAAGGVGPAVDALDSLYWSPLQMDLVLVVVYVQSYAHVA